MDADQDIMGELDDTPYEGVELIAYAIMRLAAATDRLATQVKYLGNGDAATAMGAVEAFGLHIGEKLDAMTDALRQDD